jgi:hypothetical protein
LLDSYFFLLIAIVVAVFLFTFAGMVFKNRLFRVLDRFGVQIAVLAGFVLLITAFVVYHTQRDNYLFEQTMKTDLLIINRATTELLTLGRPRHIAEPVDFHYIDTERVGPLYNQIEAALSEEKRTVSATGDVRGKVGVSTGAVSAEAEAGKGVTSTSSFSKSEISIAKKCVLVMNNIVDNRNPKYYSSKKEWILDRAAAAHALETKWAMSDPVTKDKLEELRFYEKPTPKQKADAERKTKQYEAELQQELGSLRGYVFVDGEFEKTTNGATVTLVRKFSSKPERIFFRVILSRTAAQALPLILTVFGDALRPPDKEGYVDIRPLAIY